MSDIIIRAPKIDTYITVLNILELHAVATNTSLAAHVRCGDVKITDRTDPSIAKYTCPSHPVLEQQLLMLLHALDDVVVFRNDCS